MFHVPEENRIRTGRTASDSSMGNNGSFRVDSPIRKRQLFIIASDGAGWDHVSVDAQEGKEVRTPTWREMCYVKSLFWDAEDTVIQFHPAESQYINVHEHTLHLWRPTKERLPIPPLILV